MFALILFKNKKMMADGTTLTTVQVAPTNERKYIIS